MPNRTVRVATKNFRVQSKRKDPSDLSQKRITRRIQSGFQKKRSFRKEAVKAFSKSNEKNFLSRSPMSRAPRTSAGAPGGVAGAAAPPFFPPGIPGSPGDINSSAAI